jgi:hypothetical protein
MKLYYLATIFIFFIHCKSDKEDYKKKPLIIKNHMYVPSNIPSFISQLLDNHIPYFAISDSLSFKDISSYHNFSKDNQLNISVFYKIHILHKLWTCKNANNGSIGDILKIPYYWHWVTPNPRHDIIDIASDKKLADIKPQATYNKYKSIADIDRTPYLYISDLVAREPRYKSPLCDTFATFGWCSEREMAFVCLTDILGFKGKVVAEGNHSWSELLVDMADNQGVIKHFIVKIDNTFDKIDWIPIQQSDIPNWHNYLGDAPLSKWYNEKAHSTLEKEKLTKFLVNENTTQRFENAILSYYLRL